MENITFVLHSGRRRKLNVTDGFDLNVPVPDYRTIQNPKALPKKKKKNHHYNLTTATKQRGSNSSLLRVRWETRRGENGTVAFPSKFS